MNPFFDMFDNNNPYKWVSLTYSIIATTVSTPLLYLVIMFQNRKPVHNIVASDFVKHSRSCHFKQHFCSHTICPALYFWSFSPAYLLLDFDHTRKSYDSSSFIGKHYDDYKVHIHFHFEEPCSGI